MDVYTDGSCLDNGSKLKNKRGGWAFLIKESEGDEIKRDSGSVIDTTNNRMEISAAIEALKYLKSVSKEETRIRITTDSQILKNGMTLWIKNWKKNGWKSSSKKSVKNQDLWKELDDLCKCFSFIEWKWIRSHQIIDTEEKKFNEIVDNMAREKAGLLSIR